MMADVLIVAMRIGIAVFEENIGVCRLWRVGQRSQSPVCEMVT
jgi:hypothetical protein